MLYGVKIVYNLIYTIKQMKNPSCLYRKKKNM